MKFTLAPFAAALTLVIASPVLADEPAPENSEQAAQAEAATDVKDSADDQSADVSTAIEIPAITAPTQNASAPAPEAAEEPEEEAVICRSVRLDMSSRRKTRVCRTEEGWRELNQQR